MHTPTKVMLAGIALACLCTAQDHRFKKITIPSAIHAALRATDATQTCLNSRNPGWHERSLPWQSCGAIAAYSGAMIPAEIASRYILHRLGWHHLEPVNSGVWTAFVARSIEYSSTH